MFLHRTDIELQPEGLSHDGEYKAKQDIGGLTSRKFKGYSTFDYVKDANLKAWNRAVGFKRLLEDYDEGVAKGFLTMFTLAENAKIVSALVKGAGNE